MVVNLCLPHFYTTAHCNKLCADGYDVTNLVSADPTLRNRGFKLEYFLRPPVQVELCRVDVELWPWGMDRGQACKRLEISTSSDQLPSQNSGEGSKQVQEKEQMQMQVKDQNKQNKQHEQNSRPKGHPWSLQARHWGEEAPDEPKRKGRVFKCPSNTESSNSEPEFKLVGRCELREETRISFTRSNCNPRPPFLSPPPPQPANCRQEDLWSRGLLSLGAVTQLRVTVPLGGAASALGLKALVVWGQPARCCPAEEVERIKRVHTASERRLPRPVLFAPSVSQMKAQVPADTLTNDLSIPEEFLDPITQEIMMLPMLLPSGMSVDNSTLEEHQKREATWGRPPNDPFTGVPFTSTCQPLPNPQLKSRIDHFLLQKGMAGRDGMLGGRGEGENLQASRLITSKEDNGLSQNSPCLSKSSTNNTVDQYNVHTRKTDSTTRTKDSGFGHSSHNRNHIKTSNSSKTDNKSELERKKIQDLCRESSDGLTAEQQLLPQTKRPRFDAVSSTSSSSHEQRLSASLDEALFSALQGRPSFTSNLSKKCNVTPESEPNNSSQHCQATGTPVMPTGEKTTCSACSCSVSVYSKSASSIYSLTCGHLICRSCLRRESHPLNSVTVLTSNYVSCPDCQSSTPRSDIVRVHH
ncbi:RING finger protein 37 isoform X2 [Acanthopagrus latus]|uniref:RING finger protein 37 isoform X2 n=1 Tax=Acanthopagrus latus TaxID=8177 RepID=UPI00187C0FFE|nr:RING finger protein 37 isoform X2 [Acanthopagrus latus]